MIKVSFDGKQQFIEGNEVSVDSMLKKMKINPETVLVSKNGEIALEDETVSEKDSVEILKVISGG